MNLQKWIYNLRALVYMLENKNLLRRDELGLELRGFRREEKEEEVGGKGSWKEEGEQTRRARAREKEQERERDVYIYSRRREEAVERRREKETSDHCCQISRGKRQAGRRERRKESDRTQVGVESNSVTFSKPTTPMNPIRLSSIHRPSE